MDKIFNKETTIKKISFYIGVDKSFTNDKCRFYLYCTRSEMSLYHYLIDLDESINQVVFNKFDMQMVLEN